MQAANQQLDDVLASIYERLGQSKSGLDIKSDFTERVMLQLDKVIHNSRKIGLALGMFVGVMAVAGAVGAGGALAVNSVLSVAGLNEGVLAEWLVASSMAVGLWSVFDSSDKLLNPIFRLIDKIGVSTSASDNINTISDERLIKNLIYLSKESGLKQALNYFSSIEQSASQERLEQFKNYLKTHHQATVSPGSESLLSLDPSHEPTKNDLTKAVMSVIEENAILNQSVGIAPLPHQAAVTFVLDPKMVENSTNGLSPEVLNNNFSVLKGAETASISHADVAPANQLDFKPVPALRM